MASINDAALPSTPLTAQQEDLVAKVPQQVPLDEAFGRMLATTTQLARTVVPFYSFLAGQAGRLVGQNPAEQRAAVSANEAEHPGAALLGTGAGFGLGLLKGPDLSELSRPARIAAGSGIAALFGAGELAADEMDGSPLSVEKIKHRIGVPALIAAGLGLVGEVPGAASSMLRRLSVNRARRALNLSFTPDEVGTATRALDEGLLSQPGAMQAEAQRVAAGKGLNQAAAGIEAPVAAETAVAPPAPTAPDWLEPTAHATPEAAAPATEVTSQFADRLNRIADQLDKVPEADMARRQLQDAAKRVTDPSATYSDLHELQKSFADNARSESIQPASRRLFDEANKYLKGALQEQAPEMAQLSKEYGFYSQVAPAAEKAANARMGLRFGGLNIPLPLPNMAQQARAANATQKVVSSFDEALESEVGRLFTGQANRTLSNEVNLQDFKKVQDLIKGVRADPRGTTDRLRQATSGLPPHIQEPLIAQTLAAVDHLDQLHQTTVANPHVPLPGSEEWEPNDSQKAQFLEAYKVMSDPTYALRNPTPEGMGVLKATSPETLNAYTKAVTNRLAESKNLPYDVKSKVSAVLGMPMDASHLPDFGARQQARMKAFRERKAQMGQEGSARTRASTMKADKAATTRAQRIQGEQEQF